MRSLVDADLALRGPATAPVLTGSVHGEERASGPGRSTPPAGCSTSPAGGNAVVPPSKARCRPSRAESLSFDVRLVAPSTLRIDNDQARIVASADLNLRGTSIGRWCSAAPTSSAAKSSFEGRRYLVTRGSLDFTNPDRIQPFFDIEAETRVRVPGQTYRVTLRMAGTTERLQPEFTSDPPLPPLDILTLLFSDSGAERRRRAGRAAAAQRAAAAAARGARHARAHRRAVGRSRPGRPADLWRRHVPDHAAAGRPLSAVGAPERQPVGARHDRQAHLGPHLPDLRAQPVVVDPRRDHPAGVRPERDAGVGAVAERGPHLRARGAQEARVLMRALALLLVGLLALAGRAEAAHRAVARPDDHRRARPTRSRAPAWTTGVLELVETRARRASGDAAGPRHHRSPGRPRPLRRRAAERGGRRRMATASCSRWVLRPIQRIVRTTTTGGGDARRRAPCARRSTTGLGGEPPVARAPRVCVGRDGVSTAITAIARRRCLRQLDADVARKAP